MLNIGIGKNQNITEYLKSVNFRNKFVKYPFVFLLILVIVYNIGFGIYKNDQLDNIVNNLLNNADVIKNSEYIWVKTVLTITCIFVIFVLFYSILYFAGKFKDYFNEKFVWLLSVVFVLSITYGLCYSGQIQDYYSGNETFDYKIKSIDYLGQFKNTKTDNILLGFQIKTDAKRKVQTRPGDALVIKIKFQDSDTITIKYLFDTPTDVDNFVVYLPRPKYIPPDPENMIKPVTLENEMTINKGIINFNDYFNGFDYELDYTGNISVIPYYPNISKDEYVFNTSMFYIFIVSVFIFMIFIGVNIYSNLTPVSGKLTFSVNPDTVRIIAYNNLAVMIVVAITITQVFVAPKIDLSQSPLVSTFGYNNICVNWDYEPAMSSIAALYILVEIPILCYVFLDWLRMRKFFEIGKITHKEIITLSIACATEALMFALFRMIFVLKAFEDVGGHTVPFLGLQVAIVINAIVNLYFYKRIGVLEGKKYILGILYVMALVVVTAVKIVVDSAELSGYPMVDVTQESAKKFAMSTDVIWMVLGAVIPFFLASHFRKNTPFLTFVVT